MGHKTTATDDKKLQSSLKKLAANTFAITGHAENKVLTEMLPGILNQLGAEGLQNLRKLAERMPQSRMADLENGIEEVDDDDDDVPDLVDNFDEPSKHEGD